MDKDRILAVQGEIIPDDQDPSVRRSWQVYGASKIDVGDHALVSDINAVSVAACTYHGASRKFVVEAERFYPQRDGAKGRREALTRFLTAYFPAALRAAGCAP
ncbi:hypothetical protein [Streptomyces sp. NPDC096033]|uniref:hypothetical protein n=1 Tax=Streptomyces sp. NPDC096033 TaxID=3366071 RepID=UPI00381F135F